MTLHKKSSFPLRISSVDVTRSARNCRFGHIYWRNRQWQCEWLVTEYCNHSVSFICLLHVNCRSSSPEVFCKTGVLKNFAKSTGKHLSQSIFFNKADSFKKETLAQVFSCELCKIYKNIFFFIEHFWWLIL